MVVSSKFSSFTIMGADLGQTGDPAAAFVLQKRNYPDEFMGPRPLPKFRCTSIRRWELGTSYCDIVRDIIDFSADVIVPEFNGVGRPVVDLLREEAMKRRFQGKIRPVVTAASNARVKLKSEERGKHWIVPKQDIVTSIVIAQQKQLLQLPNTPEVDVLLAELSNFQMRYTKKANLQYGNAPGRGAHDDLVIALGLACWYALHFATKQVTMWC